MDLGEYVDTRHVEALIPMQDERAQKEKAWLEKFDQQIRDASPEERIELMNLQSADESDKRTVDQHYPKLSSTGFIYQAFAICSNNQANILKDMTNDMPKEWYKFESS